MTSVSKAVSGLVITVLGGALLTAAPASAMVAAPAARASACHRPAHGFVPNRAHIPAVGRTVRVREVPRTADNAVGAGPLTERGKWMMAMDPHNHPGSHRGSVLLSAHAWPDGSALGNAMTRDLHRGDRITLAGQDGQRACYRVTKRKSYPAENVPTREAFRTHGPERLVLVTCSGVRRGPGDWSRRTLWYARPVQAHKAAPNPSTPPPSDGGSGGLFGGLFGGLLGG